MYIVVVGGGKVGYYLTKTLVTEGYEVLLIEKDAAKVRTWSERFGAVVSIERIDVEFSYGETGCFAAARRTGNDDHSRSRQVSPRSLCLRPCAYLRGGRSSGGCHARR